MNGKKGFTLIELLVVIAIIGILSSIVLVALRGARNKAKDARIIADVGQMRSMAEVLYGDGNYDDIDCPTVGTDCTCDDTDDDMDRLCEDIYSQKSDAGLLTNPKAGEDEYCIQVELHDGFYCVDSTGKAAEYDTDPACDDTSGSEVYTCD